MPFPVFSESCFLSIKPVSKGPNGSNTERHCQSASNHNTRLQRPLVWLTERHCQSASNHNLARASPPLCTTERHCQSASNHNENGYPNPPNPTERHCQSASNHNKHMHSLFNNPLKDIVKVHQITTRTTSTRLVLD